MTPPMKTRATFILIFFAWVLPCLSSAQSLTRGPYLQSGSTTSVTVKWRTSSAAASVVKYGTTAGNLTQTASDPASVTNHVVKLTGLTPNTKYFYSVGHGSTVLASGTDVFVVTAPTSAKPTRIWVLGDAGTGNSAQASVRDAYYAFTGTRHTDFVMMLGDNAYPDGTDAEHQAKLFNIYPTMLKKTVVWSTLGNHEGHTATSSTQSGPYYDIWTFPKQGESGGVASGTEAYYSFDYGNIHFVCLDSYGTSRSATGTMANWLRSDLDNHTRHWLVAFFHHPPYSKGSHNSDSETELVQMRTNLVPILEEYGVDLILCGHSHAYERSKYIDGHYGISSTFNAATMVIQTGSGREDGTGAYHKAVGDTAAGAVYAVAGSSGQTSGGTLNHPAHYISLNEHGSMVLDFDGNRLDAKMVSSNGTIRDYFTILKDSASPPSAPVNVAATAGNAQVSLSWTASSGATSYNVKRGTTSGGPYTTIAGPTTTGHVNTGLSNGTTYYYVVSAVNASGESSNSSQVSATPSAALPPTLTFIDTKDAMVKEKFPDTNFGADLMLQASGEATFRKQSFMQFTVSGIPAGATGITAQLKLRAQTTGTGRSVTAHAVADTSWSGATVTWNNKPALGASLSTVSSHTAGLDTTWNVSAHVTGNGTFALGLASSFVGDTTFDSRESSTQPTLVVSYNTGTPPPPVTVSFAPVKDSMVKAAATTTNFGSQTQMQVSAQSGFQKQMFLQFDVSGIPAGATVTSATLRIASQTTGTGRTVTAKAVSTTSWVETGITWSNKPALGATLSSVSAHTAGQDSAWNVGAHVVGNGSFSIGLDSTFAGDTNFHSRESGAATAPELVITYQP
jgi:hypothetical protein